MKPRTDTALARQVGQSFRSPARLVSGDEIETKSGQPQKLYTRRERVRDEKIISNVERIFGL